jgi:hypothetical protein
MCPQRPKMSIIELLFSLLNSTHNKEFHLKNIFSLPFVCMCGGQGEEKKWKLQSYDQNEHHVVF